MAVGRSCQKSRIPHYLSFSFPQGLTLLLSIPQDLFASALAKNDDPDQFRGSPVTPSPSSCFGGLSITNLSVRADFSVSVPVGHQQGGVHTQKETASGSARARVSHDTVTFWQLAPAVFRQLRALDGITEGSFQTSLTSQALRVFSPNSRSGAFFFL
eukprot:gb/GEZN01007472.1/.p1 GENE.gb/GEZN01007472.1/~~gb/GEZN01007472.1/.p1  ORF type:complete len:157 (-),score=12.08 gb/GEZN01007472.1/:229-699(-)